MSDADTLAPTLQPDSILFFVKLLREIHEIPICCHIVTAVFQLFFKIQRQSTAGVSIENPFIHRPIRMLLFTGASTARSKIGTSSLF